MKWSKLLLFFILCTTSIFSQSKIIEYEFWINNNYASKNLVQVSPTSYLNLQTKLDLQQISFGFNWLNIRFKDNQGRWSSTYSTLFFKTQNSSDTIRKVVECLYWIDNDYQNHKSFAIKSEKNIVEDLNISNIPDGFHRISFIFKDNTGLFSNSFSYLIFKAGKGKLADNKIVGYQFWFNQNIAEAKFVKLGEPQKLSHINAILDMPTDNAETVNIQFLDTAGLWSVVYTKKFLPEADFTYYNTINTFNFTNQTIFGTQYRWNFGDGTNSLAIHPTHTYKTPGVYEVCLIATNKLGSDTACKQALVYGLREIEPKSAGNTGEATLFIYGAGFDEKTKIYIQNKAGNKIEPKFVQHYKLDALKCVFDLRDKQIGVYDVIAEFKGNVYKLEKSFTIEQGTKPDPFVTITGRDRILFSRWQTYTLNFGNRGNVDAIGVPIIIVLSESADLEVEFPELILNQNPILLNDTNYIKYWKTLPNHFSINNLFNEPFNGRVYYFYIPRIPSNFNGSMKVNLKTKDDIQIFTWTTGPYFMSPLDERVEWCIRLAILKGIKDGLIDIGLQNAPIIGCINQFWSNYLEPYLWESGLPKPDPSYNRPKSWKETIFSWGNQALDLSILLVNCLKDFVGPLKAYSIAIQIITLINDVKKNYLTDKDCRERYKNEPRSETKIRTVYSLDPNEIVGPKGYGNPNYITDQIGFTYTIYFENLKTASAPAQEVIIVDTLSPNLFDFKSFSFGKINWADNHITPLPNLKEFTLDVPLRPKNPNNLRINGSFDTATGIIRWHFMTLDTISFDLPQDPDGGFLPPNVTPPEGEGFVQFSINLKKNLPHDTKIDNQAVIVFDLNQPIFTNVYSNKLDLVPPMSRLKNIYKISYGEPNTYRITGTATDNGSGVNYRTIFVSVNDGTYFPLTTMTTDEIYLRLEPDSIYKFYSIAVDNTGNIEAEKSSFEVSTLYASLENNPLIEGFNLQVFPNPATNFINIKCNLPQEGNMIIHVEDLLGRTIIFDNLGRITSGIFEHKLQLDGLSVGTYILTVKLNNTKIVTILKIKG